MALTVGSKVTVKPPFDFSFPGVRVISGRNEETGAWQLDDGIDFDETHLQEVVD